MDIAYEAHDRFINEDIKGIGELLYEAWLNKSKISNLISNSAIDVVVKDVIDMGAYGVKLLGAGGCGFLLVLCNPIIKNKIIDKYKNEILEFNLDKHGDTQIYP